MPAAATQTSWLPPLKLPNWLDRITLRFGQSIRAINSSGQPFSATNWGADFSAKAGTPIYAPNDGIVSFAGWNEGGGNYLTLDHGGSISTGFAHLSQFAVKQGDKIKRGQLIGYVGDTGKYTTGPHLYFEVKVNGKPVNPLDLFDPTTSIDPKAYLAAAATSLEDVVKKIIADIPGTTELGNPGYLAIPDSHKGCPAGTKAYQFPSIGNPSGTHVCYVDLADVAKLPWQDAAGVVESVPAFVGSLGEFVFGGGLVQFLINLLVLMAGGALVLIGGRMIWSAA